jgi:metallophosphoesterase superfamily enzyme
MTGAGRDRDRRDDRVGVRRPDFAGARADSIQLVVFPAFSAAA